MNKFFLVLVFWIKFYFIRMGNLKKNYVSLKYYVYSVKYILIVYKFLKLENFYSILE